MADDLRELIDSPKLVLGTLESTLRRRSDERVQVALEVAVLRIGEFTEREIRARLELTQARYADVIEELREALQEIAC